MLGIIKYCILFLLFNSIIFVLNAEDIDSLQLTPEVAPEATPEVVPETTPEVTPEVAPEVAPEVTPQPTVSPKTKKKTKSSTTSKTKINTKTKIKKKISTSNKTNPLIISNVIYNPSFLIGVWNKNKKINILDYIYFSELSPNISLLGTKAEFYLPNLTSLNWLNWFGIEINYSSYKNLSMAIKSSNNEGLATINAQGNCLTLAFSIRPTFSYIFLSRVQVVFDFLNTCNDNITLNTNYYSNNSEKIQTKILSKGLALGLEYEANPITNIILGLGYKMFLNSTFAISEKEQTINGNYSNMLFIGFIGMRYPFNNLHHRIIMEAKLFANYEIENFKSTQINNSYLVKKSLLTNIGVISLGYVY